MKKYIFITLIALSACAQSPQYARTPLYKDISGQKRGDGQLTMAEAYCRNDVSYVERYDEHMPYYSGNQGQALGKAINRVQNAMAGPSYDDCMLSQGFQLAGYE